MKKLFFYLALCLPVMFFSCDNDDDLGDTPNDALITGDCLNVSNNSATVQGRVDVSKYPEMQACGIAYGTSPNLLDGPMVMKGATLKPNEKDFTVELLNLEADKTYYYAVYVFLGRNNYKYGKVRNFATTNLTAVTGKATGLSATGAKLTGGTNLTDAEKTKFEYGFEVSMSDDFASAVRFKSGNLNGGVFTATATDLHPSRKFYYRAYVGNVKGEVKTFFTTSMPNEYVDLDLPSKTLWATMNVGALSPTEEGLYFQWADTKGYTSDTGDGKVFNFGSCIYATGSGNECTAITKYNGESPEIGVHYLELLPEDDAATQNWGSDWCMPTVVQVWELLEYTTRNVVYIDDVACMEYTSKSNGKSIILPYTGVRYDASFKYYKYSVDPEHPEDATAKYWTRSYYPNGPKSTDAWVINANFRQIPLGGDDRSLPLLWFRYSSGQS